jgi:hypothetical protein
MIFEIANQGSRYVLWFFKLDSGKYTYILPLPFQVPKRDKLPTMYLVFVSKKTKYLRLFENLTMYVLLSPLVHFSQKQNIVGYLTMCCRKIPKGDRTWSNPFS